MEDHLLLHIETKQIIKAPIRNEYWANKTLNLGGSYRTDLLEKSGLQKKKLYETILIHPTNLKENGWSYVQHASEGIRGYMVVPRLQSCNIECDAMYSHQHWYLITEVVLVDWAKGLQSALQNGLPYPDTRRVCLFAPLWLINRATSELRMDRRNQQLGSGHGHTWMQNMRCGCVMD